MWRPSSLRELEENGWLFIGIGIVVAVSSGIIWINVFGEAMELTALDILTNPMTAIGYIVIVMGVVMIGYSRFLQAMGEQNVPEPTRRDSKGYSCPKCGEPQSLADDAESWYCEYCEE